MFKDLKEVWGWGKQELRLLESNEAATDCGSHCSLLMNMALYAMTELATWDCTSAELVDRNDSPWDDPTRRPSHTDRRNFLRRGMLLNEFNLALSVQPITTELKNMLKKLLNLAA